MPLPVTSFKNQPASGRYNPGSSQSMKRRFMDMQQDSHEELRDSSMGWNNYFAGFQERQISTPDGTFIFLAKPTSESIDGTGLAPWTCQKMPGRIIRVWPAGVYDGLGTRNEPTWEGTPVPPESSIEIPIPNTGNSGFVYVESTTDDSDDFHGLITAAEIKITTELNFDFNQASGGKVKTAIAFYRLTGQSDFVIEPLRNFIFLLRRDGPPGSPTWNADFML